MKLTIKATSLEITPEIHSYLEEKIGNLDKFMPEVDSSVEAWVELARTTYHHQTGDIFRAEVDIRVPGEILRAEAERENIFLAINEVKDELQQQIKKYKNRLIAKKRRQERMRKRITAFSPLAWLKERFFEGRRDKMI